MEYEMSHENYSYPKESLPASRQTGLANSLPVRSGGHLTKSKNKKYTNEN